ncbi:MAG: hypothetical protein QM718_11005 [Steroidobacteraceae bacterium]
MNRITERDHGVSGGLLTLLIGLTLGVLCGLFWRTVGHAISWLFGWGN